MAPWVHSGRPYERRKKELRAYSESINAPCALCGKPIDYTLRFPNKWAFTVDHRQARWAGGNKLDRANLQPAHHSCNSRRGALEQARRTQPPTHTSTTW